MWPSHPSGFQSAGLSVPCLRGFAFSSVGSRERISVRRATELSSVATIFCGQCSFKLQLFHVPGACELFLKLSPWSPMVEDLASDAALRGDAKLKEGDVAPTRYSKLKEGDEEDVAVSSLDAVRTNPREVGDSVKLQSCKVVTACAGERADVPLE